MHTATSIVVTLIILGCLLAAAGDAGLLLVPLAAWPVFLLVSRLFGATAAVRERQELDNALKREELARRAAERLGE